MEVLLHAKIHRTHRTGPRLSAGCVIVHSSTTPSASTKLSAEGEFSPCSPSRRGKTDQTIDVQELLCTYPHHSHCRKSMLEAHVLRGAKICSRPLVKNVVSSALGAIEKLWRTGHYLAQPFCGCPQELERLEQYFPSNGQISVCFISQLCKIGHLTRAAQGSRRPGPAGGQQHAGRSKHEPILVRKDTQD